MSRYFVKYMLLIMVVLGLTLLAACGSGNKSGMGATIQPNESDAASTTEKPTTVEIETTEKEEWGVSCEHVTGLGVDLSTFVLHYPVYTGISQGTGWVAPQGQPVLVIVDRQCSLSPDVDKLEDVFPAYFKQTDITLKDYYGARSDNFQFTVDQTETITIGDYDMIKLTGGCDYEYERKPEHQEYVAYATQLKENGAYVYWMLMYRNEDDGMKELAEDWAYNMALSFYET